jgi:endonuclease IV
VVLNQDLPEAIKKSAEAYTACISGAAKKDEYLKTIKDANFQEITIIEETPIPSEWTDTLATLMEQITLTDAASSIKVKAIKPK